MTDDSDGEDVIEVIEIENEMEPEKTDTKSISSQSSMKKNDIAPVTETAVPPG